MGRFHKYVGKRTFIHFSGSGICRTWFFNYINANFFCNYCKFTSNSLNQNAVIAKRNVTIAKIFSNNCYLLTHFQSSYSTKYFFAIVAYDIF